MSGQWEVVKNVRRSKLPVSSGKNKPVETKKKNTNILNGVKIEEVLSKSQVQNLYAGKQGNKENKQPDKPKNSENKKPEKKSTNKSPSDPPKPKPPKSIEAGLTAINPEEFSDIYDRSKKAFPDAPIVWLKEITQFLNQKIPIEIQDPVFSNKPHGFPLNVVPAGIKATIEKAVKEVGKSNAQAYFDIALTTMVSDLGKGLTAVGYRFLLQYIALNEPKLVITSLNKHIALRNSYQNRANVTLSILWAVGYVGVNDLQCGLKVFEDLMLPLIDLKSYSHYVVKYLSDLLSRDYETYLTKDQYVLILDIIHSNRKNFPRDLQKELAGSQPKLENLLFRNNKQKYNDYIELFLKKIASNSNTSYQDALCDTIVQILAKDQSTLSTWNKIYSKNLMASTILLRYISNNYESINSSLVKSLKDLLLSFSSTNDELSLKKRKDEGLKEAIKIVKKLQEQKQAPKQDGIIKYIIFFMSVICLFLMTEPLIRTDKKLEEFYIYRICHPVEEAIIWARITIATNTPQPVKEFVEPCWNLAVDLIYGLINILESFRHAFREYIKEKYPIVIAKIDSYAPGFIENTQSLFEGTFANTVYYYETSINYLEKEVFVGKLSPENIQRVVVGAFNTTSEKAIEYYHWVYEKVQTSIK